MKMINKQWLIIFVLSHLAILCAGQGQLEIAGKVQDGSTREGVPFATIHILGTSIGTCSNLRGDFSLKIPDGHSGGRLVISSMGYESTQLAIDQSVGKALSIPLTSSVIELEAVMVRSQSPEELINRAMSKLEMNYGRQFSANTYFRQTSADGGKELQFAEGYMEAFFEDFLSDTSAIDQRLLLHRKEEHFERMVFRTRKREKKFAKSVKKAAKENLVLDEDSLRRSTRKISLDLITPDLMMDLDPVRLRETFLDSTQFKHYDFAFGDDLLYRGRRVTVIGFKSGGKAKLENVGLKGFVNGKIYLDQQTDAILGIDYYYEMVIPAVAQPILFLLGLGASNPVMTNNTRYLELDGKWFPQSIQTNMSVDLKKRYWFKKSEKSSIDLELLMAVSNIIAENPPHIEEEYRFSSKKKFEEQVYPYPNSSWDRVNRIEMEVLGE